MPQSVHSFRLEATFGPEDVFRALKSVCEHPAQRDADARFEFEWFRQRVALSANSPEALEAMHQALMARVRKGSAGEDALLPGKVEEKEGRWTRPYGVAVLDPATFGEMIGQSLVDIGLRGVQVVDSAGVCRLRVRQSPMAKSLDYRTFIMEFPLPPYLRVVDEGIVTAEDDRPKKKR